MNKEIVIEAGVLTREKCELVPEFRKHEHGCEHCVKAWNCVVYKHDPARVLLEEMPCTNIALCPHCGFAWWMRTSVPKKCPKCTKRLKLSDIALWHTSEWHLKRIFGEKDYCENCNGTLYDGEIVRCPNCPKPMPKVE